MYLADQASLEAFVERIAGAEVLAIDTEFLRETTYYPKLCLLQMATDDEVAIIDPLSVDDLSVIAPLLEDERTVKLFHAGGQDIEILLREVGSMPRPLFDTQVAVASFSAIRSRLATGRSCMLFAASRSRKPTPIPIGRSAALRFSDRLCGRRRDLSSARIP